MIIVTIINELVIHFGKANLLFTSIPRLYRRRIIGFGFGVHHDACQQSREEED